MLNTIIDAVKDQAIVALKSKLDLNTTEIDTVLSSSKDAIEKSVAEETSSNGVETLLNLFSGNNNNDAANNLLGSLGGNLISSLTSNGFDGLKSSQIKDIVLPLIINFVSNKVGGDSFNLTKMFGGLLEGGNNASGGDMLGKVGSGLLNNLFK